MKKLKSTLPNMIASLGLVTILAGALLGVVYYYTQKPIAEAESRAKTEAISEVVPKFDNDPQTMSRRYDIDGTETTVYPAYMADKLVGAAVLTSSMNGFGGEIRVMVGFDADCNVTDYRVLSHAETPGLGSKMATWFRDPTADRSIIGKNPDNTQFYVSKDKEDDGQIDAITAATISSRAFLECVRTAHQAFETYKSELTHE